MRRRTGALVLIASLGVAACGSADPGLRAGDANSVAIDDPIGADVPDEPQDSTPPVDTTPDEPVDTLAPIEDSNGQIAPIPAGEFPLDPSKPPQQYDGYLIAVLDDIQQFWRTTYRQVYGDEYVELEGGIWPVYRDKFGTPGCGTPETTFLDVEGNAFYCSLGDFVAYDDTTLLPQLEAELGTSVIGVIMAHEWGHAIQNRAGLFDPNLGIPTVTTELQADCFAGAWAAHLRRGENPQLNFSDADLKTGLSGMIVVADSPGSSSADPAAHGSAFDRVGAFQDGYLNSAVRCGEYIDNPPTPLQFQYGIDEFTEFGEPVDNAPFEDQGGCLDGTTTCGIFELLIPELNLYWAARVPGFTDLAITTYEGEYSTACPDEQTSPLVFLTAAFYCPGSETVFVDLAGARAYYDRFGDYALGYLLSAAWADAVQSKIGSTLEGEPRVLVNDCLVGAFTRTGLPEAFNPNRSENVRLSPGDLDEAVKTAIEIGDLAESTDEVGTAFDKIDAFRVGVIGDLEACQAQLGG